MHTHGSEDSLGCQPSPFTWFDSRSLLSLFCVNLASWSVTLWGFSYPPSPCRSTVVTDACIIIQAFTWVPEISPQLLMGLFLSVCFVLTSGCGGHLFSLPCTESDRMSQLLSVRWGERPDVEGIWGKHGSTDKTGSIHFLNGEWYLELRQPYCEHKTVRTKIKSRYVRGAGIKDGWSPALWWFVWTDPTALAWVTSFPILCYSN